MLGIAALLAPVSAIAQGAPLCTDTTSRSGLPWCRCTDGTEVPEFMAVALCQPPARDEPRQAAPLRYPKLGLMIQAAPEGLSGVVIASVEPGSEADAKGIMSGAIITSVHSNAVYAPDDVVRSITQAYDDGRAAVLMKIDGAFVAIPFSDRKGQRLPDKTSPPVLLHGPLPAKKLVRQDEPGSELATPIKTARPDAIIAASPSLPQSTDWLPIILALVTGMLATPYLARGYRLATNRWRSSDKIAGAAHVHGHIPSREEPAASDVRMPRQPRDTPAALQAMRLAFAYLEELRAAGDPNPENTADRKARLNTLALAAKQLARAERLDPDAVLEGEGDSGGQYRLSITQLKALALTAEAITHQHYDHRRALAPLIAATRLDPHDDMAFYLLGSIQLSNKNRSAAIAALRRAVELNPGEIDYRKELDRAQNMSGFEIAGYKASRAGEHALTVGYVIWIILKILFFPVVICFEAFRFAARHSSTYR